MSFKTPLSSGALYEQCYTTTVLFNMDILAKVMKEVPSAVT